jgi:hypothetical protein
MPFAEQVLHVQLVRTCRRVNLFEHMHTTVLHQKPRCADNLL